jgi:hypothetical protein
MIGRIAKRKKLPCVISVKDIREQEKIEAKHRS